MHKATSRISPDNFASYEDALKSTTIFSSCKTDLISEFLSSSSIKTFAKGEHIFLHGDSANWFYLVISGWVKLYRETMDGNEAVIDVHGANEIFGELSIFADFTQNCNCETIEQAEILLLPLGLLSQKIEEIPNLAINMLKYSAQIGADKSKEIEHLIVQNAPQRIGCFLLRLCANSKYDSAVLHLPYDKTMIAAKLGMQPETFSRALAKLKDATGIKVVSGNVEIPNIAKLSHFCCGACSSSFPCSS